MQQASSGTTYNKVSDEDDTVIPFVDPETNSFIDCYADSIVTLPDGITYTVGEPCDYAVALGYVDEREGGLVPLELDDPMMDDVFPVAELIIEEEFGEELSLQRTPQTLTLVGELEEGGGTRRTMRTILGRNTTMTRKGWKMTKKKLRYYFRLSTETRNSTLSDY